MPSNWTALKCEGCGNPLEPLARNDSGLILFDSAAAVEELQEVMEAMKSDKRSFSSIPIVGGDTKFELIKSPLADLLKCTSCGMLYERNANASRD